MVFSIFFFLSIDYTFIGFMFPGIRRELFCGHIILVLAGNDQKDWLIPVLNSAL